MSSEIIIAIVSTVASTAVLFFISWLAKRALQDLKNQMLPNGGGSLFDQARDAKTLSKKAVELAIVTEARLSKLEDKVDALILSNLQ